eukprot:195728-Chlamydomonas_euryale.AAC.1
MPSPHPHPSPTSRRGKIRPLLSAAATPPRACPFAERFTPATSIVATALPAATAPRGRGCN